MSKINKSTMIMSFLMITILCSNSTLFNASEIEQNNPATNEVVYAPTSPTAEEVESAAPTDLVVFPDENLEAAISSQTGLPVGEITVGDMESLTQLSLNKANISDLSGIEYATNVINLKIEDNNISDLSPLSGLTNLLYLYASRNQITDLSPLSGLTNLNTIFLNSDPITDLSPIANLTNLERLDLSYTGSSDLSALADLTELRLLDLSGNDITDLSPLAGLTNLRILYLKYNQISNLSPLAGLINLTTIELTNNQISDLSPLAGLVNLKTLDLVDNQISDLSPLAGLINLKTLDLMRNQISDLSPLAGLINLTDLNLVNNQVSDLTPLAGLTSLEDLRLNKNEISDLTPLAGLTSLEDLDLSYNKISDVTPIADLPNLSRVRLALNSISDISSLARLENASLIYVGGQDIQLEDITVSSNDEIVYNVVDIDGTVVPVSLGIPAVGSNSMRARWDIARPESSVVTEFSGSVQQKVNYTSGSEITGNESATINEEGPLTDDELITLFNVSTTSGGTITVNQSSVDYSTPGEYEVKFIDSDGSTFIGMLTVNDVLPTISIDNDSVTISTGDSIDDITSQLTLSASEITEGDLTDLITYDDSAVDYTTVGEYTITFSVNDEEGNIASKIVTVTVSDDSQEVIDPDTPSETTSEDVNNNDEAADEKSDNSETLAVTGSKAIELIVILVVVLLVVLGIKKVINKK